MEHLSTSCCDTQEEDSSAFAFTEFLEVDKMLKNWDCEEGWEEEIQIITRLMAGGLTWFGK